MATDVLEANTILPPRVKLRHSHNTRSRKRLESDRLFQSQSYSQIFHRGLLFTSGHLKAKANDTRRVKDRILKKVHKQGKFDRS